MSTLLRSLIEKVYVRETNKSRLKLIKWMQRKGLLHGKMKCRRCNKRMKMVTSSCKDGYIWQCKKSCGRCRKSIRTKSIFSHSHASFFSWMKYIHRFSQGLHMRQVDMMLDDISNSSATLSKMSMKLRSVCVRSMRKYRKKRGQKVGGLNICVHIDESKFRHRRKAVTSQEAAASCNVWHLNVDFLPDWILASIDQVNWTVGKLNCQYCGARLGGFNFVNFSKCTCGHDTTVHLSKSRVDQDLITPVLLSRPGRTRGHAGRWRNEVESISSGPSPSSTLRFSCTVTHVVSAESELEVEEPQILETVERGTDVPLPSELPPQLSDFQDILEEWRVGSASQSRVSLDGAMGPEGVRLTVMEEPLRNISSNLEPKLSKREKNRLKSLRRKQRKKERWIQRQQEVKELAMKWDLTGSDDEEREGYTCAVCLDVYYSPYKCHPCSHVFCEPCLRTLAKNRPSNTPCPLCRTLISHVLFQEELNQTTKTSFPKVYWSRHETFQKTNYSKWPLPNCPKRFRIFWGFQRHGGSAGRWQFPHRAFGWDALDLGDMWGWPFDIDFVIISVYSLHWLMAFIIFCGLCYFLLL